MGVILSSKKEQDIRFLKSLVADIESGRAFVRQATLTENSVSEEKVAIDIEYIKEEDK